MSEIKTMGIGSAANTHSMYQTINHEHLDCLVSWARGGDFPDAGLNLAECADGRWFVEVAHGIAFDHVEGIARPNVAPFTEPVFFGSESEARDFAFACIKAVYPELADKDLSEYYADDDSD